MADKKAFADMTMIHTTHRLSDKIFYSQMIDDLVLAVVSQCWPLIRDTD